MSLPAAGEMSVQLGDCVVTAVVASNNGRIIVSTEPGLAWPLDAVVWNAIFARDANVEPSVTCATYVPLHYPIQADQFVFFTSDAADRVSLTLEYPAD